MADETFNDGLEKSEEATAKRREDARKQGQFVKSRILVPVATAIAMTCALQLVGRNLIEGLALTQSIFFRLAGDPTHRTGITVKALIADSAVKCLPALLVLWLSVVLGGLAAGFLQTGFVLAQEPVTMDWRRVNPLGGFQRLFSWDALFEGVKGAVILVVLGVTGIRFLSGEFWMLTALPALSPGEIFSRAINRGSTLAAYVIAAMVTIVALDYLWQRWQLEKKLRMSRHEVKEEMREQEGDPVLKSRFKKLRQRLGRSRMIKEVEKADVVITNPTHLAVALRYSAQIMRAPQVVAKGADFMAARIRNVARSKHLPIIEDRPLARLLFQQVAIGEEIPESLYRAVAGVLAYVYRLRDRNGRGQTAGNSIGTGHIEEHRIGDL
jgi:flagellar biosynthetic protein FlhB